MTTAYRAVLVFTNVNEEGVEYGEHSTLEPALALLDEFPNDSIVITYRATKERILSPPSKAGQDLGPRSGQGLVLR